MWYKNIAGRFFGLVTKYACDRPTDRRTELRLPRRASIELRRAVTTIHSMLPVRCLSVCVCLSVTLVYCGQIFGWIKMKLGMQVGLGPGHFVLDGDPGPSPQRAQPPIFGSYLLWPNGSMDQDATWYESMPRPKRHSATHRMTDYTHLPKQRKRRRSKIS